MQRMPAVVVPRRRLELRDVLLRKCQPQKDDTGRIAIGEGTQQHAVEQRKHGAVDADAERERQDDEQGEAGTANGIAPRQEKIAMHELLDGHRL